MRNFDSFLRRKMFVEVQKIINFKLGEILINDHITASRREVRAVSIRINKRLLSF